MTARSRAAATVTFSLVLIGSALGAQEIITPAEFLARVSQKFGTIRDYQADVTITGEEGEEPMAGKLLYKSPNKIRIDFTRPREQVLSSNGEVLVIYVPKYSYVLEQRLQRRSSAALALAATQRELSYLKSHYSVAYVVGPEPVPLEEGSREMVTKLKFQSLSVEGFRRLEIAFDRNLMMRRITGSTANKTLVVDLKNVRVNQGIADARFNYDPPASANVYRNFLFDTE